MPQRNFICEMGLVYGRVIVCATVSATLCQNSTICLTEQTWIMDICEQWSWSWPMSLVHNTSAPPGKYTCQFSSKSFDGCLSYWQDTNLGQL